MIDESVVEVTEILDMKTDWGVIKVVKGKNIKGELATRSLRMPGTMPVSEAQRLCNLRGGQFSPSTPIDPKRQLLADLEALPSKERKQVLEALVEDFEMEAPKLADWSAKNKNDLPDSSFVVVLSGGHKDEMGRTVPRSLRLLPYKDSSGKIDKSNVQNALARVNQINVPASVKLSALRKLLGIARALGIKVQENSRFKLDDLDFYLEKLEVLEKL